MEDFLQMNSDILSIFVIIERIFSSIYGFMYVLSSFLFEVCSNVANFSEKVFVLSSKGFFFFNPLYFHDMQMLYFILPPILFLIGVFGICFFTQNFIIFVMCLEVIALASFLNFILFSLYLNNPIGQIYALFILAIAAGEGAVGLGIFIASYRLKKSIDFFSYNFLRG